MAQASPAPIRKDDNVAWTPTAAPGIFALAPFPLFFSRLDATLCACHAPLGCARKEASPWAERSTPRASARRRAPHLAAEQPADSECQANGSSPVASPSVASPLFPETSSWRRRGLLAAFRCTYASDKPDGGTERPALPVRAHNSRGGHEDAGCEAEGPEGRPGSANCIPLFCCTRWKHFTPHRVPTADSRVDGADDSARAHADGEAAEPETRRNSPAGSRVVCGLLIFDGCEFFEGRLLYRHLNPHLCWNTETWNRLFYALTNPSGAAASSLPTSSSPLSPVSVSRPRRSNSPPATASSALASPSAAWPGRSEAPVLAVPLCADRSSVSRVRLLVHRLEPTASDEEDSSLSAKSGLGDRRGELGEEAQPSPRSSSLQQWDLPTGTAPSLQSPTRLPSATLSATASPTVLSLSSLTGLPHAAGFKSKLASSASTPQSSTHRGARKIASGTPKKTYALSLVMGLGNEASELSVHLTAPIRLQALSASAGTTKLFTASLLLQQLQLQEQRRLFEYAQKCASSLETCTAELATAAVTRERQERRLLRGMCLLLNSKKKKLRELERELEDHRKKLAASGHGAASEASSGLLAASEEARRGAGSKEGRGSAERHARHATAEEPEKEGQATSSFVATPPSLTGRGSCRRVSFSGKGAAREEPGLHMRDSSQVDRSAEDGETSPGSNQTEQEVGDKERGGQPPQRFPSLSRDTRSRLIPQAGSGGKRPATEEDSGEAEKDDSGAESSGEEDECLRWAAAEQGRVAKKRKVVEGEAHTPRRAQSSREALELVSSNVAESDATAVQNAHSDSDTRKTGKPATGVGLQSRRRHNAASASASRQLSSSSSRPPSAPSCAGLAAPNNPQLAGMLEVTDSDKFAAAFALIAVKKEPESASEETQLPHAGEERDPRGNSTLRLSPGEEEPLKRRLRPRRREGRVEETQESPSSLERENDVGSAEAETSPQSGAKGRNRGSRRTRASKGPRKQASDSSGLLPFSEKESGGREVASRAKAREERRGEAELEEAGDGENEQAERKEESDSLEETQCLGGETLEWSLPDSDIHESPGGGAKKAGRRLRRRRAYSGSGRDARP
ncbi:conserved hypothetical protein [Neospora caninum Liverpool]|uniref:Uncharacterized protein n=1 Tax=Neospora caninum (strain Liverpool) TaxID=572307 RepID=F0VNA3_NEOCL|nr:conserved hypothetical protein [Neospora caninum Liverpool]CBZ55199.1 conserved hypothetical protein [Neospora caninum Liverpool]CEL69926.1 TPA: hypothetical protein BN1204_056230 [Neospora caninum Liverpool]|eukprot:XP_003885227.1 conserved hypothetical protein [Neospora caninum Liverpool]